MSKRKNKICPRCGGKVYAPRRGATLDASIAVHEDTCPGALPKPTKKEQ